MTLRFLESAPDLTAPTFVRAYDEQPLWSAAFGLLLLEHVPLGARRALDVGCGTGFPLIELAERLGPRSTVDGLDPWTQALDRAAEKIAAYGATNIALHRGTASVMPFAEDTFDLIVSNLGVNNFDDPGAAVRECRRVARAGGVLALTTNLRGHMREFYAIFDGVLRAIADTAALQRLRDHIDGRASIASVEALLETHGFRVRKVVEHIAVMRFADGTALLNHHFVKLAFLDGWTRVAGEPPAAVFAALLDALNESARTSGELRLTVPMAYIEAVAVA